jgi:nucleoside-diphosphate-sugar epimerase
MPTRVLITGGAGYIGSVLCEHLLAAGYAVHVVDSLMYGSAGLFHLAASPNFEFTRADARDERAIKDAVRRADVIVPLAAIVGAPACQRDPALAESVNLDAVRLVNRLRSHSQLVVYPNTNSGYGTKTGDAYCDEDSPLQPISVYGTTKVQAEQALLDSPNAVSLRLATVFGASPRMRIDLLVNHFTYAAVTDGFIVIYQKEFKRNYVHIRDVADCFLHVMKNSGRMAGRPYNLGLDAANLNKEELALKIKEQVPGFYIHFAPVGEDPDKRNYLVSNKRLKDAGFEASRSLDSGISELIKAFRMVGRGQFANA